MAMRPMTIPGHGTFRVLDSHPSVPMAHDHYHLYGPPDPPFFDPYHPARMPVHPYYTGYQSRRIVEDPDSIEVYCDPHSAPLTILTFIHEFPKESLPCHSFSSVTRPAPGIVAKQQRPAYATTESSTIVSDFKP